MHDDGSIVRTCGLTKVYGRRWFRAGHRALDGVDLEIERGSVFGLLGPNGAGKTTLLKILIGLARASAGEAWLLGERAGATRVRRRIGYLPEAHRLPQYMTGRQVLRLYGMLCGRERRWLDQRIPRWLERVGMQADADRKIREYSKGMQQRIGLAQALIHEPELVFLDEPTDGVDPIGRADIREIVLDLRRAGCTVFINSHLLMEVELVCDRVVIMDRGRILRAGAVDELTRATGRVRFAIDPVPAHLPAILDGLGQRLDVGPGGFELNVQDGELDQAIDRLRSAGVSIRAVEPHRLTLEQAFISLVQERGA